MGEDDTNDLHVKLVSNMVLSEAYRGWKDFDIRIFQGYRVTTVKRPHVVMLSSLLEFHRRSLQPQASQAAARCVSVQTCRSHLQAPQRTIQPRARLSGPQSAYFRWPLGSCSRAGGAVVARRNPHYTWLSVLPVPPNRHRCLLHATGVPSFAKALSGSIRPVVICPSSSRALRQTAHGAVQTSLDSIGDIAPEIRQTHQGASRHMIRADVRPSLCLLVSVAPSVTWFDVNGPAVLLTRATP